MTRRGRAGILVALLAVAVVAVAGAGAAAAVLIGRNPDYPGPGSGSVVVQVRQGDTLKAIGQRLKDADVVESVGAFRDAASSNSRAESVQPGYYRLRHKMKASEALAFLLDPAHRVEARVVIPEGTRLQKILDIVAANTKITKAELQAALANPAALGLPAYAHGSVEGYLFPATYLVPPHTTALALLQEMAARFVQAAAAVNLDQGAAALGLTPDQVVTVASLVQAEGNPTDYAKIARVVYNRLQPNSPTRGYLQFDTTVLYAQGRSGSLNVSNQDTRVNSPYNTYLHPGLPPGPIDSPGEAALEAAMNPAPGPWIYYVTTDPKTGETKFTADYQEFLQYKQEFQKNAASGG